MSTSITELSNSYRSRNPSYCRERDMGRDPALTVKDTAVMGRVWARGAAFCNLLRSLVLVG